MARLKRIFRTLCLVMLPALLAQGAQAAEPPQFGARLGVGADVTLAPFYWVMLKESGSVAATMRCQTAEHWDFETELGISSWGIRYPWSRENAFNETLLSVQVPLMGRFWWDESRTGLYLSFGAQLHFMLGGEYKEGRFSESENRYYSGFRRLKPVWTPSEFRRLKNDEVDDNDYLLPATLSIPFRVGWKFRKFPLDLAFATHQVLYYPYVKGSFFFPVHLGASCTWWF